MYLWILLPPHKYIHLQQIHFYYRRSQKMHGKQIPTRLVIACINIIDQRLHICFKNQMKTPSSPPRAPGLYEYRLSTAHNNQCRSILSAFRCACLMRFRSFLSVFLRGSFSGSTARGNSDRRKAK